MDGNADASLLEGSDLSHWIAGSQTWEQDNIVKPELQTPDCAWDQAAARCR